MKNFKPITHFALGFLMCFTLFTFMGSHSNVEATSWTYLVVAVDPDKGIEEDINDFAKEGWTLVNIYAYGNYGNENLVLKRPK